MNLDDRNAFRTLDPQDLRAHLDNLPTQLDAAWKHGQNLPLPGSFQRVDRIVVAAMGTPAVSGDLLVALLADSCNVPIFVCRGYDLPAFADGQRTLVIIASHTGNTEETLSLWELADARGTQILALTSSAALAEQVEQRGGTVWLYEYEGYSRTALGWIFGLLLVLVNRLGLVRNLAAEVAETVEMLQARVPVLGIDGVVGKNPAKRLAGQMIGRIPVIYGSGILAPVARRWKMQLNENAKTWAQFEQLPEINHNASAGITFPRPLMTKVSVVILSSPQYDHPRVALRQTFTKEMYLQQGIAVDVIKMRGNSPLGQMLSGVQYGDYVSYYVAMGYGVDPAPTPSLAELKERLASSQEVTHDSHD
jgi:glucose/mannose-6-phosphate isomerase